MAQATQRTLDGYERKRYGKDHFRQYPERRLRLDYCMLRFPKSEVALKTTDQDPAAWFTAKHIPERNQVALHLRVPVRDEWNNLGDHLDLDIYFQAQQVAEIMELLTESAQPRRILKLRTQTVNRLGRQ